VKGLIAEGKKKIVLNIGQRHLLSTAPGSARSSPRITASSPKAPRCASATRQQVPGSSAITKLLTVFDVFNTEAEAVRSSHSRSLHL